MSAWSFTNVDREFVARHVEPYLPDRVFDAHAHLFSQNHYPNATRLHAERLSLGVDAGGIVTGGVPAHLKGAPIDIGINYYRDQIEWLHPNGRTQGGLFFGLAFQGDRAGNDRFVADEIAKGQAQGFAARGQMLIAPEMDAEYVREQVKRYGFVGLKPYHLMAKTDGPTFLAPIEDYLTEEHIRIAHEEGLTITLHMVRDRALADPVNQATIRRYCLDYPNMRLILAHAARGFNPWHTIEGIHSLEGLPNVWCDTSAVTEAGAFEVIVETLGHEKLLYGTDFHVSHLRGRCIAIGDSFHWLYADEMHLDEKHTTLKPVLIGLESLRSVILAMHRLKLKDSQIEDIFYGNAASLLT